MQVGFIFDSRQEQKISCVPDVYHWQASRGDWLIVGCDGIFDFLNNENARRSELKPGHMPCLGTQDFKFRIHKFHFVWGNTPSRLMDFRISLGNFRRLSLGHGLATQVVGVLHTMAKHGKGAGRTGSGHDSAQKMR